MRRALRLASRGRYRAAPNPMVGCVVIKDGKVLGEGFHEAAGEPHAEVMALRAAGRAAEGATAVVTLEPCAHQGRTPPCVDALIQAGIARVVAAHGDPDPRVEGEGFSRLRDAGIEVVDGVHAEEAALLNLHYLVDRILQRPAVTMKWAMSLDGRIATASGESQWITSPPGRRWALDLRELHDTILVGSGTVLADDPRLTRRLSRAVGPIVRVVLDRRLRTPPRARLWAESGPVLVYSERCDPDDRARAARRKALEQAGATVVELAAVTPPAVLEDLYRRGSRSVLVEGGASVLGSFTRERAFDRVMVACAPRLIGGAGAPGPIGGVGGGSLSETPWLEHVHTGKRGPDLIVSGVRSGCLLDLLSNAGD